MLSKFVIPNSISRFEKCVLSNKNKNINNLYLKLKPNLFDVSLRDGLQSLNKEQQEKFSLFEKKLLFHNIVLNQQPKSIEIGSIVSNKILPVFHDTLDLHDYVINYNKYLLIDKPNYYILIPNKENLKKVINNLTINNFSLITSVSNSFQYKNTKMSLNEGDQEIYNILYQFEENVNRKIKPNIKLYVSCINECPIEGKIDNDFIVNRILMLNKMNVDNICLSDTCGSLLLEDFEYIVESCIFFGLEPSKISLHLHVKQGREDIVESIIHKAFDFKINNFDVSILESGGCSVTMDKDNLSPNLSYDLFYKSLYNYILKKN